jgi:hypothetical protein
MDKQDLNAGHEQHSGDNEKQQADLKDQVEPIPNLPDECGDSMWEPVLLQQAVNLLEGKNIDKSKNANNADSASDSAAS